MSEWREIANWPHYEVSVDGRVRKVGGEEIGQWLNDAGYYLVRLSRPRAIVRVHRLVAAAFVQNHDDLPFVNHIDCDPANNHADNLEWCTQRQNVQHSARLGRMPCCWRGKRSPNARLSDEQVGEIRLAHAAGGWSLAKLGAVYGASKRSIGRIVNGEAYV